jgi:hypothetical protein
MKRILMVLAAGVCLGCLGEEGFRIFTGNEGRVIEARILSCDARTGKVTVERNDRRKITVPSTVFSEADQAYIKEWISAQDFLSESKLRISVSKKKGKTGDDKSQTKRPKSPVHYEITLENRSGAPIAGIRLEYCLFMNSENLRGGEDRLSVECGASDPIRVEDRGRHMLETKEVELFRYYTEQHETWVNSDGSVEYNTSYNKMSEDNMEGIRVRAYFTTPSGKLFTREVCDPSSIGKEFAWKDPS